MMNYWFMNYINVKQKNQTTSKKEQYIDQSIN